MQAVLRSITKEDQRIAKSSISKLRETSERIRSSEEDFVEIKFSENGDFLRIPKKALSLLFEILSNMAQGKSLTLISSDTELSTQQAADMLNVSRPHLVKLLEEGEIPFKKAGTHRRIELKNLIAYEKRLKENRNGKLNFLAKQAQDLNLGY